MEELDHKNVLSPIKMLHRIAMAGPSNLVKDIDRSAMFIMEVLSPWHAREDRKIQHMHVQHLGRLGPQVPPLLLAKGSDKDKER